MLLGKINRTKLESMKLNRLLIFYSLLGILMASCIKDEAPNAEADILSCSLQGDVLNREAIINNDNIILSLKDDANIQQLAPEFVLTAGATIEPASGTMRDFSSPKQYTVTSEDGKWKKTYTIEAFYSGLPTSYHFEETIPFKNSTGDIIYYNFRETDNIGNTLIWANANSGFNYTGVRAAADDYPTSPAPNGVKSNCVKLTTKSTGSLGALLGMYLASGNLFIGQFTITLPNVVKATKFGAPFKHVPTAITGYYKYKAGSTFTVDGKAVTGRTDICDIYGIFYETDDEVKLLDGTNAFTSDHLISVARISDAHETDEWTEFNIPFITKEGKTIDAQKLKDGKYNVAIVFSSSIRGDLFEGAEGSTLYIDEVELKYTDL